MADTKMARKQLTDLEIRKAKPREKLCKLSDGRLQLWVTPDGTKYWRLAYELGGKQKVHAIGVYPKVTLEQARSVREEAEAALAEGLAHVDNDSVRRAYHRADYWDERVKMMTYWADRCDAMKRGGDVVEFTRSGGVSA